VNDQLDMEPWTTEKSCATIGYLARAMAATARVADPDVREAIHSALHVALGSAMTLAARALNDPALFSIARIDEISANPEMALAWCEDAGGEFPGHSGRRSLADQVDQQIESARRWRAGERPPWLKSEVP
jgi:hypothetical protein